MDESWGGFMRNDLEVLEPDMYVSVVRMME